MFLHKKGDGMEELIFVLLVIFVTYVVYQTVNEGKEKSIKEEPRPEEDTKVDLSAAAKTEVVVPVKKPTTIKPKVIKKATTKAKVEPKAETSVVTAVTTKKGLKNPLTGEVATTYSNYRFTKRWIKDALVTEGLLDQVYKNAELTDAVEANIKTAIIKLEALDNYKP